MKNEVKFEGQFEGPWNLQIIGPYEIVFAKNKVKRMDKNSANIAQK